MIPGEMTVLLVAISETAEPVLVSDTKVYKNPVYRAIKTLRLNDNCAVGCSCNSGWGGSVFAALFWKRELEFSDPNADILQALEDCKAERPDLGCEAAIKEMNRVLKTYEDLLARCGGKMDVNFALCGVENSVPVAVTWRRAGPGWVCVPVHGYNPLKPLFGFFVPGTVSEADEEMLKTDRPFYDRATAACELFAEKFPDKVNKDLWIRRPAGFYRRESLASVIASNSPAPGSP